MRERNPKVTKTGVGGALPALCMLVLAATIVANGRLSWPFALVLALLWLAGRTSSRFANALKPVLISAAIGAALAWLIVWLVPHWASTDPAGVARTLEDYDALLKQLRSHVDAVQSDLMFWVILTLGAGAAAIAWGVMGLLDSILWYRRCLSGALVILCCLMTLKVTNLSAITDQEHQVSRVRETFGARIEAYRDLRQVISGRMHLAITVSMQQESLLASLVRVLELLRSDPLLPGMLDHELSEFASTLHDPVSPCGSGYERDQDVASACSLFDPDEYSRYADADRHGRMEAIFMLIQATARHASPTFPSAAVTLQEPDDLETKGTEREISRAEHALRTEEDKLSDLLARNDERAAKIKEAERAIVEASKEVVSEALVDQGMHVLVAEAIRALAGELAAASMEILLAKGSPLDQRNIRHQVKAASESTGATAMGQRAVELVRISTSRFRHALNALESTSFPTMVAGMKKAGKEMKRSNFFLPGQKTDEAFKHMSAQRIFGRASPWQIAYRKHPKNAKDGGVLNRELALRWLASRQDIRTPEEYRAWYTDRMRQHEQFEKKQREIHQQWKAHQRAEARARQEARQRAARPARR